MRLLLIPFSWIYGWITTFRNTLYDKGIKSSYRFGIAVINVGNLSTGGTGKTPHIEYLIRLLKDRYKIAVLSRGYKRNTKGFLLVRENMAVEKSGDEPAQLKRKFPDVHVAVCENRVKGCFNLLATYPDLDVILLDDAFQHRAVKAGLNILLTSYGKLYTNDYLLPAGNLRESKKGSKRAHIIIVSKVPANINETDQQELANEIDPDKDQSLYLSSLRYDQLTNLWNPIEKTEPVDCFRDKPVILVTGIARSKKLYLEIEKYQRNIIHFRFKDHHRYTESDVKQIAKKCISLNGIIVTTEKDAVKLGQNNGRNILSSLPIYVWPVAVEFHPNDKKSFENRILTYVEKNKRNRSISKNQN